MKSKEQIQRKIIAKKAVLHKNYRNRVFKGSVKVSADLQDVDRHLKKEVQLLEWSLTTTLVSIQKEIDGRRYVLKNHKDEHCDEIIINLEKQIKLLEWVLSLK